MSEALTREEWLNIAVQACRPILLEAALDLPSVKVSVGFPSKRALSSSKRAIGECWHHEGIEQAESHLFISPVISNPVEIFGVVIHELLHAALPSKTKHNKVFARAAINCGLDGKPTATVVTPESALHHRLNDLLADMPAYPHIAFDASNAKKKQTTRLRLYICACGTKVRVASDSFDATCNVCSEPFTLQTKEGE